MPIFKQQRYRHSVNAVEDARRAGCEVYECRTDNGRRRTFWVHSPDGKEHLGIKEGEVGPATNMHIVLTFSKWGIIMLVMGVVLGALAQLFGLG
ncbi:hypothetical protein [Kaarinaea lacus]